MTTPPIRNAAYAPVDAAILDAAKKRDGYSVAPAHGLTVVQVRGRVERFIKLGKLHAGRAGHRTVHYFTDPGRAAEWAQQHETAESKRAKAIKAGAPAWRGATLPKDAPAVIPPHVKVQVIAHRPGRYEITGPIERAITNDWLAERMGARRHA